MLLALVRQLVANVYARRAWGTSDGIGGQLGKTCSDIGAAMIASVGGVVVCAVHTVRGVRVERVLVLRLALQAGARRDGSANQPAWSAATQTTDVEAEAG